MCFHLGFVHAYIWDYGTKQERWTRRDETREISEEIHHEFVKNDGEVQYRHKVGSRTKRNFLGSHVRVVWMTPILTWPSKVFLSVSVCSGEKVTSSFRTTPRLAMKLIPTHSCRCLRWDSESCTEPPWKAQFPQPSHTPGSRATVLQPKKRMNFEQCLIAVKWRQTVILSHVAKRHNLGSHSRHNMSGKGNCRKGNYGIVFPVLSWQFSLLFFLTVIRSRGLS